MRSSLAALAVAAFAASSAVAQTGAGTAGETEHLATLGLTDYAHTLAALALWAVLMSVLMGLSTLGRTPEGRCDCGKPRRDYADPVYRRERAFANAVETSGPFVAATVAAVLTGAAPFWVNLFASVFVVARLAMAVVHVRTEHQLARSACFAVGVFCVLGLAILALIGAFDG